MPAYFSICPQIWWDTKACLWIFALFIYLFFTDNDFFTIGPLYFNPNSKTFYNFWAPCVLKNKNSKKKKKREKLISVWLAAFKTWFWHVDSNREIFENSIYLKIARAKLTVWLAIEEGLLTMGLHLCMKWYYWCESRAKVLNNVDAILSHFLFEFTEKLQFSLCSE